MSTFQVYVFTSIELGVVREGERVEFFFRTFSCPEQDLAELEEANPESVSERASSGGLKVVAIGNRVWQREQ